MIRRLALSIFILTLYQCANSQPVKWREYYESINRAEMLHYNGDLLTADSTYKKAFSLVDNPFKEDYFLAAKNSVAYRDFKSTSFYLKKASEKGLELKRIRKDGAFREFIQSDEMKVLSAGYREAKGTFKNSLHDSLNQVIASMVKRDQKIRLGMGIFMSWKRKKEIDTKHFEQLKNICLKFGWPGISLIGEDTPKGKYNVTGNVALLLLHFQLKEIAQLDSFMVMAIQNGEMYPYHYARVYDYKHLARHGKQLYGTYKSDGKLAPVDNILLANVRRRAIGLEPLEEYAKKENLLFDQSE